MSRNRLDVSSFSYRLPLLTTACALAGVPFIDVLVNQRFIVVHATLTGRKVRTVERPTAKLISSDRIEIGIRSGQIGDSSAICAHSICTGRIRSNIARYIHTACCSIAQRTT